MNIEENKKIDKFITIFPAILIVLLCIFFIIYPNNSNTILTNVRFFFGDTCSLYYLIFGILTFIISIYMAFSKYGKIKLGSKNDKPEYSFLQWGGMMFCAGLAADILFYSLSEWLLYINESYINNFQDIYLTSITYSLFHWGFTPWSFYLVLASCFGFMIHCKNRNRQRFSEAVRPLFGKKIDGVLGKIIDTLAIFALIAGCATTFSLATPLMTNIISTLLNIPSSKYITIILLLFVCAIYITSLLHGLKGINLLSKICMYIFIIFLLYIFIGSNKELYIIKMGFLSILNLIKEIIPMYTYVDSIRNNSFPQNYTSFYWAYWMVWCVAAPFFIGQISKGRTIKQTILGGYTFGLLSTFISFIVLSNFTISLQLDNIVNLEEIYRNTNDLYYAIMSALSTLPFPKLSYIILFFSMLCFYATSFDSISLVASYYSYKNIYSNEIPSIKIKLFWAILLILFPIALIFSDSSMANLQAVSIISAFPIGIVIILIIISFFKDAKNSI
ncbi:MAG: BCCT family transporter [Eubacteriales bacterium]|nr:BCCT family transporter [Eubacteriales bacterium]